MTHKKKILIISISIGLAVVIAVTFITLAFTVWMQKPKTTQEWLNDFKACLTMANKKGRFTKTIFDVLEMPNVKAFLDSIEYF